ncbi:MULTISPECIES: acyl carrier protein [unclassified Streptomyces]|uniref:acyl carrier protein n=1 Tax=unclassified Streptomyces TaxID=2593676 RepID=UPI002253BCCE|nr:acyl carrier protein [Streptomyces sp. NBC_00047]MCX5612915.1 acyl carrier protein [Streptomyces sp. NBC_00047]
MRHLELTDLTRLLHDCAGAEEGVDLDGADVLDTLFYDLGYDSLALLQTTGLIERKYGITLDEEAMDEAETPRKYLELVNRVLSARVSA